MAKIKRRHFILGAVGAAGALVVGWSIAPARQRLTPSEPPDVARGEVALNGWVKVSTDNTVAIVMSQAEMGQGVHTGLAMLLSDEMDAAWEQVRIAPSSGDSIYNNQTAIADFLPLFRANDDGVVAGAARHMTRKIARETGFIVTGGSTSIKDQWLPMREAGASARQMLIAAAAGLWKVPASECFAQDGRISHSSGRAATYGALVEHTAGLSVPRKITLKTRDEFKLIGKPVRRLESAAKIDGSAVYGLDALPPGLLYASIRMCPTLGGSVADFDATRARVVPGVRKVISLDAIPGRGNASGTSGGIVVIADTPHHAMRALDAVAITWDHGAAASLTSRAVMENLRKAADRDGANVFYESGDVDHAFEMSTQVIEAVYEVPFLAHMAMEPLNCTVQVNDYSVTAWVGTQSSTFARDAIAGALAVEPGTVDVRVPFLGGGFGRRIFTDYIVQAARIAREVHGEPVQLIWSREQDVTHDYYRPAYVSRCRAGFSDAGQLIAWQTTSAGSALGGSSSIHNATEGASDTAYRFANARVAHHKVEAEVPVGIWRSVGHSQNAFFTESFVDECAASVQRDPVAFRAELLRDSPRHLRVLDCAAQLARWGQPLETGVDGAKRAQGIAIHSCFGSIVAQVAEISVTPDKKIRVHRVVCVIDCGFAVNPDLIRQQMEGAIVFGLSAALFGEITIENGEVQQSNFHDFEVLRIDQCPVIETEIIEGNDSPGGVGEPGTPPIAPAVANAVFALTGQRLRRLPFALV